MAERTANSNDHNDGGDDEETNSLTHNNKNNNQFMQIVFSDGSAHNVPHATYIVQIPKDQIYRVPPPENAEIVERYRNPVEQKQRGGGRRCAYWFLSIFLVLAFIISAIVCVHKFTLSPNPPKFSIKHVAVNNSSKSTSKTNASPGFQVSMETTNPNNVNDLGYNQGIVLLWYKGKQIGKGHFPALDNEGPGKSNGVNITLVWLSKGGLPSDLESNKKLPTKKGNTVDMNLSISIPIKMKTWLWTNTVDYNVKCEFEVEPKGEHLQIQSENCDVHK